MIKLASYNMRKGIGTDRRRDPERTLQVLREIDADVILKATKVDGIYCSDPKKNPDARRFEQVSFREALARQLKVMDSTAFSLCMDNNKSIIVFDMHQTDNIRRALDGETIGTLVCAGPTLPADLASVG